MSKRDKENVFRDKVGWGRGLTLLLGYLILTIWIVFTVAFPIWILGANLSTSREILTGTVFKFESGIHLKSYVSAWKGNNVSIYFANSLLYAVSSCFMVILISAPTAYVLSRFTFPGNKGVRTGLILAMSVPEVMAIMPIYSLTAQYCIRGKILLVILCIPLRTLFTTTYLLNFFASLSKSYEEATAVDGCTPSKTLWEIMFPLIQSAVVTVIIFNFMSVWNEFFMALIFATSTGIAPVGVGLLQIINAMKYTGDCGKLFAAVAIVFLPTFLLFILLSEKTISGVTDGGVKG